MNIKEIKRVTVKIFTDWDENVGHLKWIWNLTKGFRKYIWGYLIISGFSMAISLSSSVAGKYAVDAATGFADGIFYKYLIVMAATTIISLIMNVVSNMFNSYVSEKYSFSLRAKMFNKIQRGNWFDVSKFHSGDIIVRINDDLNSIAGSIITLAPSVIVSGIQLLIVLSILLRYEPTLAIIGLIVGPLGFAVTVIFRKQYSKYEKKLRETRSEYQSFFQDVFSNLAITKVFQLEDYNIDRFEDTRSRRLSLVIKSSKVSAAMSSAMRIIYSGGYLLCFSYCAYLLSQNTSYANAGAIVNGTFTYGTMTLFLTLVNRIESSISSIGSLVPSLFSMLIAAKRVREVSEIEEEEYLEKNTEPKEVGVKVNNITFGYTEEVTVLNKVSFEIKPGKVVGLVGRSGTGKTTMIRLLLALTKPNDGSIEYIDENGTAEKASTASRRFISYVPQGNTLLTGTIRSNLAVSAPNVTEEAMWNALRIADADSFVKKLPEGLDTPISEKAGGISEGQAQRISIARAVLRDKPLLILDEATSALDEQTEAKICETISKEINKTCIIITHRSSMLKFCDNVIRINEEGNITLE